MAVGSAGTGVPGFVEINAAQAAANAAAVPQVVLDDSLNGSVVAHLAGKGPAPTIAVVIAGAGTSGTAALDTNATDLCGKITLVTGSAAWGTGAQATVTFGTPHLVATYVVLVPADTATALLAKTVAPGALAVALTGFSLVLGAADSAAHTMTFFYHVLGA